MGKGIHKRRISKYTPTIGITLLLGTAIIIGVFWNFIQVRDETGTANTLQLIVSTVAIISGLSGMIIGISSLRSAQLDSVRDYFTTGDTEEFSYARSVIYKYGEHKEKYNSSVFDKDFQMEHYNINREPKILNKDDVFKAVSYVSNFFHQWGMLAKNKYLPMWVFESASGIAVFRLYEYSKDIIENYRNTNNPYYGENFEWLYQKIQKVYKHEITYYKNSIK